MPLLGLAADEACLLCDHAKMDSHHLLRCTGLDEYPTDDVICRSIKSWSPLLCFSLGVYDSHLLCNCIR
ncbi:hypothetical protein TNCV_4287411 [Trichonephila clavipes]|uniref:Uncharacterized protein n=1 Tax=Trichonephila clavipes TaxID=2585209 RepID=A0A8X6VJ18_TRICX|nr:hypothetical protein TNCV_4287411 [Trichonephila clavipes]